MRGRREIPCQAPSRSPDGIAILRHRAAPYIIMRRPRLCAAATPPPDIYGTGQRASVISVSRALRSPHAVLDVIVDDEVQLLISKAVMLR